tara:strand:+ start:4032 stop:4415 length:384 start_codon:yes stop_codon:yes gene_type:complete
MDSKLLIATITEDIKEGCQPIMAIGIASDICTGVVDNLAENSIIFKKHDLDGAYVAPLQWYGKSIIYSKGGEADSTVLDPHKWLYSPLEAGCTLVKNPQHLIDTYSSHPEYYVFGKDEEEKMQNFCE